MLSTAGTKLVTNRANDEVIANPQTSDKTKSKGEYCNSEGFHTPNENKMHDGGRDRESLGFEV